MENIYVVIVGILFILAISDLIVGVSNDAVNFLVSAIGSKSAPFWVIMTIASLGVIVGAHDRECGRQAGISLRFQSHDRFGERDFQTGNRSGPRGLRGRRK